MTTSHPVDSRPVHPVLSLDFLKFALPCALFVTSKACLIREWSGQFEPVLIQVTFSLIFLYHFLSLFVNHSRGQHGFWLSLDLGYLVRSIGLVCLHVHPALFFLSSTFLYFSLVAEFLHYEIAPRCHADASVHIRLFTVKIMRSLHFQNFLAFTELLMIPYLFWISVHESRWDAGVLAFLCVWFFGFVGYQSSEFHRFLWQIVGAGLAISESDRKAKQRTLLANMEASCRRSRASPASFHRC
jgi:hypothetical protein